MSIFLYLAIERSEITVKVSHILDNKDLTELLCLKTLIQLFPESIIILSIL